MKGVLFSAFFLGALVVVLNQISSSVLAFIIEQGAAGVAVTLLSYALWEGVYRPRPNTPLPPLNYVVHYAKLAAYISVPMLTAVGIALLHSKEVFGAERGQQLTLALVALAVVSWACLSVWRKRRFDLKNFRDPYFWRWAALYIAVVIAAVAITSDLAYSRWKECELGICTSASMAGLVLHNVFPWTQIGIHRFSTAVTAAPWKSNQAIIIGNDAETLFQASEVAMLSNASVLVLAPVKGRTRISEQTWRRGIANLARGRDNLNVWFIKSITAIKAKSDKVHHVHEVHFEYVGAGRQAANVTANFVLVGQVCGMPDDDPCHQPWRSLVTYAFVFVTAWVADWLFYFRRGHMNWT